ncbi:MAG: family intrarane metalloprotease, partial [Thermoleophilia bacterium]|nr:family intrarane metalloprotease [Thermoleophilia bacterium]
MQCIRPAVPTPVLRPLIAGLGIVLAFVVVQALASSLVLALPGVERIDLQPLSARDAILICLVQAFAAAVALVWIHGGPGYAAAGLRTSVRRTWAATRALLPVGLLVLAPGIAVAVADGDVVDPAITPERAAAFVLLAIAISVNEELWFRGLVLARLRAGGRVWLPVFGSALLFGAPHITDEPASWLNAAAVTLAVGIPFAAVRVRYDSLWALIAWHAVVDIWAFVHTASLTPEGDPSVASAAATLVLPAAVAAGYVV